MGGVCDIAAKPPSYKGGSRGPAGEGASVVGEVPQLVGVADDVHAADAVVGDVHLDRRVSTRNRSVHTGPSMGVPAAP